MRIPPDGYAALAMGAALLLEWLAPLPFLPEAGFTQPTTIIGALVAFAALALEILAARALARAATSARPFAAPDALVTAGVFSLSRNPFYCGIILLLA